MPSPLEESPAGGQGGIAPRPDAAHALLEVMSAKQRSLALFPIVLLGVLLGAGILIFTTSPGLGLVGLAIGALPAYLAWLRDQVVRSVVLFYDLDGAASLAYRRLYEAIAELGSCERAWHVGGAGAAHGPRWRSWLAGAPGLAPRTAITIRDEVPAIVKTNVSVPALPVGSRTLYFFPDHVLMRSGSRYDAL